MTAPIHYPGVCTIDGLRELARDEIVPRADDEVLVGDGPGGTTATVTVRAWTVAGQKFKTDVGELYCRHEAPASIPVFLAAVFGEGDAEVRGWLKLVNVEEGPRQVIATWEAVEHE